jgi:hypothetical protein
MFRQAHGKRIGRVFVHGLTLTGRWGRAAGVPGSGNLRMLEPIHAWDWRDVVVTSAGV